MDEQTIEQHIMSAVKEAMKSEILPEIRTLELTTQKNKEIIDKCLCNPCEKKLSCEKRRLQD